MRIIIRSSLNLRKTSNYRVGRPPSLEYSHKTRMQHRYSAMVKYPCKNPPLFFLRVQSAQRGPQGANQMADWVTTVCRVHGELLVSLPPLFKLCKKKKKRKDINK